jgi:hypothetical protein
MNIESFWDVVALIVMIFGFLPLSGGLIIAFIGLFNYLIDELMKKGEEYIMNNNGGVPRQFTKASLEFKVMYVMSFIVGAVAVGIVFIFSNSV